MKLDVVWVSNEQKDGKYSALAVHTYEVFSGLLQSDSGFVRRDKPFLSNEVLTIPKGYDAKVVDNEWIFTQNES